MTARITPCAETLLSPWTHIELWNTPANSFTECQVSRRCLIASGVIRVIRVIRDHFSPRSREGRNHHASQSHQLCASDLRRADGDHVLTWRKRDIADLARNEERVAPCR